MPQFLHEAGFTKDGKKIGCKFLLSTERPRYDLNVVIFLKSALKMLRLRELLHENFSHKNLMAERSLIDERGREKQILANER